MFLQQSYYFTRLDIMTTNIDKTVDNMIIISGNDMIDTDEFQGAPFVFGRKCNL